MPSGAEEVQRYVGLVKEAAGEEVVQKKIRGFRYLLQGKGPGVGTQDGFVDSLRWLGKEGYSFDVGVDCHRDGVNVLGEVMEMIGRAHEGVVRKEKVVFVLSTLSHNSYVVMPSHTPTISQLVFSSSYLLLSYSYPLLSGSFAISAYSIAKSSH